MPIVSVKDHKVVVDRSNDESIKVPFAISVICSLLAISLVVLAIYAATKVRNKCLAIVLCIGLATLQLICTAVATFFIQKTIGDKLNCLDKAIMLNEIKDKTDIALLKDFAKDKYWLLNFIIIVVSCVLISIASYCALRLSSNLIKNAVNGFCMIMNLALLIIGVLVGASLAFSINNIEYDFCLKS